MLTLAALCGKTKEVVCFGPSKRSSLTAIRSVYTAKYYEFISTNEEDNKDEFESVKISCFH